MKGDLLGQTAVLIGGSPGIGLETARRARAEGAEVILTARNPECLQQPAVRLVIAIRSRPWSSSSDST